MATRRDRDQPTHPVTIPDKHLALEELAVTEASVLQYSDQILDAIEDDIEIDADQVVSGEFADLRISESSVTQHQAALALAASQIVSGAFADARISESSVAQHEAALALAASQIVSGTFANARISEASVTQHEVALSIAAAQITTGEFGAGNYVFPGQLTVSSMFRITEGTGSTVMQRFTRTALTDLSWDFRIDASGGFELRSIEDAGTTVGRVLVVNHATRQVSFDVGLPASEIVSGTFADARISEASVTQHQAALSIAASQITAGTFGAGNYTFPGNLVITDLNIGTTANVLVTMDANADFAQPAGYRTMVRNTSLLKPPGWTGHGFYWTMGRRDISGGWNGLWQAHEVTLGGRLWTVQSATGTGDPVWNELFSEQAPQNKMRDGSATLPALTFASDPDLGIYRVGSNTLGLAADGVTIRDTSATGSPILAFNQQGTQRAFMQFLDATPVLRFRNLENARYRFDTTTGSTLVEINGGAGPTVLINTGADEGLRISHNSATGGPYISFYQVGTRRAYIQYNDSITGLRISVEETGGQLAVLMPGGTRFQVTDSSVNTFVPIRSSNGTNAAPSYSFTSDTDTGVYRVASNVLGIAAAGVGIVQIASTSLRINDNGSAATPALLLNESGSGIYRTSTAIRFSFTGTLQGEITNGGQWRGTVSGGAGFPTFSFLGDENTGMYRSAADTLSFATGATKRFEISAVGVHALFPFRAADGSATAPSYSFTSDTNIGMYRVGADNLGWSVSGLMMTLNTSELEVQGDVIANV